MDAGIPMKSQWSESHFSILLTHEIPVSTTLGLTLDDHPILDPDKEEEKVKSK